MYDSVIAGLSRVWNPDTGTWLIISTPPATTVSAMPLMIAWAAIPTVWRPEEQKRLTVVAGTSTGKPARSTDSRATFNPCDASGMAQPQITSSISLGVTPARLTAAFKTSAERSTGWTFASDPSFLPRATAVRTAATMTRALGANIAA